MEAYRREKNTIERVAGVEHFCLQCLKGAHCLYIRVFKGIELGLKCLPGAILKPFCPFF